MKTVSERFKHVTIPRTAAFIFLLSFLLMIAGFSQQAQAAAGDLDPGFGIGGKVTTDFNLSYNHIRSIAVQADGKIVAVGTTYDGSNNEFVLARYNTDGSLDTGFGIGGMVITDFGSNSEYALGVVVQPDGKIVAVGNAVIGSKGYFVLARYNPDGSLDTGFGTGGKVITDFGLSGVAYSIAIQADNKIVAAGYTYSMLSTDFALARYNPDGSLDTAFGIGGKVTTDIASSPDIANSIAIQTDGKIVAAGYTLAGLSADFALVRYNSDGSLDAGFGTGGKVTTDIVPAGYDYAHSVAIQMDGKIVAAGNTVGINSDFVVARYNSDGSLDTTFGIGGKVVTDIAGSSDSAYSVVIKPDGAIIAAGIAFVSGAYANFAVACYDPNGALNNGFGVNGKVTTDFFGVSDDIAYAVAVQADGKIIAAGSATPVSGKADFALARYLGEETITVTIDIKPGSVPNSINLRSLGTVPVAILSSPTFDATTVNPATITLANAPVKLKGNGTPMASSQDVNSDGFPDLVLHIVTQALQLTAADTEAVLKGKTYDGKNLKGMDTVRIVH